MAKRFTDTSKWAKERFSNLSMKMKLVWVYLCDSCDHAGVWDINMSLVSFQVGQRVTIEEITESFGDWVELRGGNKLFLPSFVDFQYGNLNPANRVHKSILDRVEKLSPKKVLASPLEEKIRPLNGAMELVLDMELEMDMEKGSVRGKFDLDNLASEYPNKVGFAEGLRRLEPQIQNIQDAEDFKTSIQNYKKYLALPKNKTWLKAKQFDVFVGPKSKEIKPWREWVNPDSSVFDEKTKDPEADAFWEEQRKLEEARMAR